MSSRKRVGARMIVEDCDRISVAQVEQVVEGFIKSPAFELGDMLESDNRRGRLGWLLSLKKPDWFDLDEWREIATAAENIQTHDVDNSRRGYFPSERKLKFDIWLHSNLEIKVCPLNQNQVTFTSSGKKNIITYEDTFTRNYKSESGEISYNVMLKREQHGKSGFHYYFLCPLCYLGVPCLRKASVLYLPPGFKYFGCRHCYNLSYGSRNASGGAYRGLPQDYLRIDPSQLLTELNPAEGCDE